MSFSNLSNLSKNKKQSLNNILTDLFCVLEEAGAQTQRVFRPDDMSFTGNTGKTESVPSKGTSGEKKNEKKMCSLL